MYRFWKSHIEKCSFVMNFLRAFLVATFIWTGSATAEDSNAPTVKAWPYSGQWRVSLITRSGASWCQAEATGHDAQGYSISLMRVPHGMFLIYSEDRIDGYGSTLSVSVDGKPYKSFEAKTSSRGASVSLPSGNDTEDFFNTLGRGQSMSIDNGNGSHDISLSGFAKTMQNLVQCTRMLSP